MFGKGRGWDGKGGDLAAKGGAVHQARPMIRRESTGCFFTTRYPAGWRGDAAAKGGVSSLSSVGTGQIGNHGVLRTEYFSSICFLRWCCVQPWDRSHAMPHPYVYIQAHSFVRPFSELGLARKNNQVCCEKTPNAKESHVPTQC